MKTKLLLLLLTFFMSSCGVWIEREDHPKEVTKDLEAGQCYTNKLNIELKLKHYIVYKIKRKTSDKDAYVLEQWDTEKGWYSDLVIGFLASVNYVLVICPEKEPTQEALWEYM